MVGSTDARPTDASYAVFRLFAPEVRRALAALEDALGGGLAAVNAALAAAGQPAVVAAGAELRPPRPVD